MYPSQKAAAQTFGFCPSLMCSCLFSQFCCDIFFLSRLSALIRAWMLPLCWRLLAAHCKPITLTAWNQQRSSDACLLSLSAAQCFIYVCTCMQRDAERSDCTVYITLMFPFTWHTVHTWQTAQLMQVGHVHWWSCTFGLKLSKRPATFPKKIVFTLTTHYNTQGINKKLKHKITDPTVQEKPLKELSMNDW